MAEILDHGVVGTDNNDDGDTERRPGRVLGQQTVDGYIGLQTEATMAGDRTVWSTCLYCCLVQR